MDYQRQALSRGAEEDRYKKQVVGKRPTVPR